MSRKFSSGVSVTLAMIGILSCSENSVTGSDSPGSNEVRAAATTGSPGAVTDLSVSATDSTSVTLSFTQVSDGTGQPAKYDVRYAPSPISWGSAPSVASGTCTVPLLGTAVSGVLSCTVLGLKTSTKYDFQLVPYRGTLNQDAVFGPLSNVATGTTVAPAAPVPVATVSISPSSASVQAGKTVQLSATTRDSAGNILTGRTITWTTSQSSVATVSSSGLVTGVAAGSAQITATSEGKAATAPITVTSSSTSTNPGTVTNLGVSSIDTASVVLSFTQVDDGTGQPAQYDIRYAVAPISWGSATSVTSGTCKSPLSGTAIGTVLTCVVGGLKPSTKYNFQLVAFRGTLNFNAVFGALSNIAVATTTAPTAPPPPPPSAVLFQETFENSNISSRGWYDNTSAQISTTEHISGSTASAQYHWLKGASTPTSGGAQRHKFTPTSSVYVSYWVKYSTNYVGSGQTYHPHEFYILSNLDSDYSGLSNNYLDVYIEQNYQNGGRPRLAMQDNKSINTTSGSLPNNLIGVTENRSTGGCNGVVESNIFSECYNAGSNWYNDKQLTGPVTFQPNPGSGYKSNWNFVEAYFQLNTIVNGVGQANGVMQYWFNGTLIIDRHDIVFRTGYRPTLQFSQFVIAPYIGDGSPVDQYMWVDNLTVATARNP